MRVIRVLSLSFALAAASLVAHAQTFNKVIVHLPYTVMAGFRSSPPAITRSPLSTVRGRSSKSPTTATRMELSCCPPSPRRSPIPPRPRRLVLNNNGNGEYTLDQMWIQGDTTGYEFLEPKSAAAHGKQLSSVEVRAEATR